MEISKWVLIIHAVSLVHIFISNYVCRYIEMTLYIIILKLLLPFCKSCLLFWKVEWLREKKRINFHEAVEK